MIQHLLIRKSDGSHYIMEWSGDLAKDRKDCAARREYLVCSHSDKSKVEFLKVRLDAALHG